MRTLLILAATLATFQVTDSSVATAGDPLAMTQVWSRNFAQDRPWHGGYQQQNYGSPVAVVVPPTAHMRNSYSWGVSQNLMYPIHHQFGRNASGPGFGGQGGFRHTPPWPSHTDQFGYYYIRSPW